MSINATAFDWEVSGCGLKISKECNKKANHSFKD